jgi:hypothetical protein
MTDLQDGYVEEDPNFNYTPLFAFNQGNLSIGAPIENSSLATFGNQDIITPLPNPNLNNDLVFPQLQVGGTIMANDIIFR